MALAHIEEAINDIRQGKMIILVDDEDRENEGDLTMAAELVTPEAINFMARFGRGLICLALEPGMVERLQLPQMVRDNQSGFKTAFTVSIEARRGVTTGISAADRATTILTAVADNARPDDLVSPGHVFPLRAKKGGVLVRTGQTEGSVDLARLAGLKRAAVICEVMNDDGTMARMPDLEEFAAQHDLKIATIADLVEYRLAARVLCPPPGHHQTPHLFRRIYRPGLRQRHRRQSARGPGKRGGQSRRAHPGPGALRMRHRRRLPFPAVRLRRSTGSGHGKRWKRKAGG